MATLSTSDDNSCYGQVHSCRTRSRYCVVIGDNSEPLLPKTKKAITVTSSQRKEVRRNQL